MQSVAATAEIAAPGQIQAQGAVLRSQAALLSRTDLAESAAALAFELVELLRCQRVSVGLLHGRTLRVAGSSHAPDLDPHRGAHADVVAAMHEALDQRKVVCSPCTDAVPPVTLAHQLLAGSAGGAVCSVPLVDGERSVGAVTVERASEPFTAAEIELLRDVAAFAGPLLDRTQRAQMPWWRRLGTSLRGREEGRRRRWTYGGVTALVLVAVLAIPVTWRVSAPARLEGSVQRAIVASTDGFLQQANVRAGDTVRAGQVLAELASQDMDLERRRRESELRQHENAYRAAQARNDRTQMVISQSRAAEAQAMLDLVQGQLDRARIVAPFDGVVIKGDLTQTLGAPVQRGEVLLTLAPGDSFRLIVEVDESDIAAVRPGQQGRLALAAQPERQLAFVTRRVVPVATAGDGRNFFEVEGTLASTESNLRPGQGGVAKIEVGSRSIAWLLTHRMADALRLAVWSAGW